MAPSNASADDPRLVLEVEKRQPGFELTVRLTAGSEILVLFGPSGAGKTTTLNIIAGLLAPDAGEILLDGRTLFRKQRPGHPTNMPARGRRIGYVFQHYALFPHLTAQDNVAFALWRHPGSRQQALALLQRMGIEHLSQHYPRELSGGQQQRVAIARALAAGPEVLLLDEPFSALDIGLRQRLQNDLVALQQELGLVVLYVTHRLEDAFAVGRRLAVMSDGHIAQVGPIADVFDYPANHEVAAVMGIRNLFQARVVAATAEHVLLDWSGLQLEAPPQAVGVGAVVAAYIRPEDIKLLYPERRIMPAVYHNRMSGTVQDNRPGAGIHILQVRLPNGQMVEVRFPTHSYDDLCLKIGQDLQLSLRKEGLVLLNQVTAAKPVDIETGDDGRHGR